MTGYYILVEPWAVFVKEESFFISQGGLTQDWGKRWKRVEADGIEAARKIGWKEQTLFERLTQAKDACEEYARSQKTPGAEGLYHAVWHLWNRTEAGPL